MHVHPPKPLHGWKEFANEIFVIVVGVLIALGFEQVVEQLHWRHEVADARETLHAEVAQNLAMMKLTYDNVACQDANLAELQRRVAAGDVAGVHDLLELMPKINNRISTLLTSSWDLANNSGLLAHMPPAEKQALAYAYGGFGLEALYTRNRSSMMYEVQGKALVFEGSTASRERLLEQIGAVRMIYRRVEDYPGVMARIIQRTGIGPSSMDSARRLTGIDIQPCTRFDQLGKSS